MSSQAGRESERHQIIIHGIVQGVGFRPFVYTQALHWGLVGFVLNDSSGVTIEVEGTLDALNGFERALHEEAPPLARIDSINVGAVELRHETTFTIAQSEGNVGGTALISPDSATCDDCLREIFDPKDRRYGYAFTNCTNCGPRFTIIQDVPYDRDKTTMRAFPMCPACQAEYNDPLNRRFFAQPNACPICGPQVHLFDANGLSLKADDPIGIAAQQLATGAILAIKGLGGYHLVCDPFQEEVVQRLRQRTQQKTRPFPLMVLDLDTAHRLCEVSDAEAELLQSRQRPIVLLNQHTDCPVASGVTLSHTTLGIMLPYAPLYHLLLHAFQTAIAPGHAAALVVTSGNLDSEPIFYRDSDAFQRLLPIADGMLTHDRDIHIGCDDSVARIVASKKQILRRSRGYVPEPISLTVESPIPLLACGSLSNNTFCLSKGNQAFISHHIGDLNNQQTMAEFYEVLDHFQRLFNIHPDAVAYDMDPDDLATRYALTSDIPHKIDVQHHHAHVASVLAEHGLTSSVIGIVADNGGYGTDGALWGGEVLIADLEKFERFAHLSYVPLPYKEVVMADARNMALAYLVQIFGDTSLNLNIPFIETLNAAQKHLLIQANERNSARVSTSSLGLLINAAETIVGFSQWSQKKHATHELEIIAKTCSQAYPFAVSNGTPIILDTSETLRGIVVDLQHGISGLQIIGRLYYTLIEMLTLSCQQARNATNVNIVALSGGSFQNRLILEQLIARLEANNFQVYSNQQIPIHDGGLSLGQAAIAGAQLRHTSK